MCKATSVYLIAREKKFDTWEKTVGWIMLENSLMNDAYTLFCLALVGGVFSGVSSLGFLVCVGEYIRF